MKKVKVILSPEAKEVYEFLNRKSQNSKFEKAILNALHNKIERIKNDIHYGQPIAKKLIPHEYHIKYGITNLFRVELPNYWRMLYTLSNGESEIEIIAFILDLVDHKVYDKKFGYKKN